MQAGNHRHPASPNVPPQKKLSKGESVEDPFRNRLPSHLTDATPEQVAEKSPQEMSNFTVMVSRPKFMASQRRVLILKDEERVSQDVNPQNESVRVVSNSPLASNSLHTNIPPFERENFTSNQEGPGGFRAGGATAVKSENMLGEPAQPFKKHAPRLSLNGLKSPNIPMACPIMKNKPVMVYMPKKELEIWKVKPLKKGSSIGDRGSKIALPNSNITATGSGIPNNLGPVPIVKKPSIGDRKPPTGAHPPIPEHMHHHGLKSVPPRRPEQPVKEKFGNELSISPAGIKPASSPDLMDPKDNKPSGVFKMHPVPSGEIGYGVLPPNMMNSDPSQNKQQQAPKSSAVQKTTSMGRAVASQQELPSEVSGSRRRKEQVKGWESPVEKYSFPPKTPKKQSGGSTATGGSGADNGLTPFGENKKTPQ